MYIIIKNVAKIKIQCVFVLFILFGVVLLIAVLY